MLIGFMMFIGLIGSMVSGLGLRISLGFGFRVSGCRFRVSGLGFIYRV